MSSLTHLATRLPHVVPAEDNPGDFVGNVVNGAKDMIGGIVNGTKDTVETITKGVDFARDPLGAIFQAVQNGAEGLATKVVPALIQATEPDLSLDWFIRAYGVSFAASLLVWGGVQIANLVNVARGHASGHEFLEALTTRTGGFLFGALYGPLLGVMLIKTTSAASEGLAAWGITSSSAQMVKILGDMLKTSSAAIPGGVIIGIILMIVMIISLCFVVVMLVVILVTLYFSGVFVPIGLAWRTTIGNEKIRAFANKIPLLWIGILISHPLMFFLLGIGFQMIAGMADWMKWEDGLSTFMKLLAAGITMAIVGLAPFAMFAFAPVIPTGAAGQNGPSLSAPGGGGHGPQDLDEARDYARDSYGDGGSSASDGTDATAGTGTSTGGSASSGEPGPLDNHLQDLQSGGGADSSSASGGETGGSSADPTGAAGKAAAEKAPMPGGAGASAGAEAGAGAGAGAGAATGAEATAAAGAAESSTGVGVAIGIPTLVAAGAQMVTDQVKEASAQAASMAEAGGRHAAAAMDEK